MILFFSLDRTKNILNKTMYPGLATKAKDEIEIDNLVLSN